MTQTGKPDDLQETTCNRPEGIINGRSRSDDSPWRRSIRALLRNKLAMAGAGVLIFWALLALFAPLISPYDPNEQEVYNRLSPPSSMHLFGTDQMGRDVFSRVLYGARISIPSGVTIILIELVIGSVIGAISAYIGGAFDMLVMRIADVTLSFPAIVLALAVASVLGPSLRNTMLAMILVWWPEYARLMRSEVLRLKESEYVLAAQCLGVPSLKVLFRHIAPNAISSNIVKASLDAGNVILFIAALSFIGLGVVPPTAEWGAMIAEGRLKFYDWWLTTFPGLAMLSVVLALNLFGDGARDAFDPRVVGT